MKKLLLSVALLSATFGYSQEPIVYNGEFTKGVKAGSSNLCSCSGWVNTDIADQGESTTEGGDDVLKIDNLESDGAYQEIEVLANTNYTLDLDYRFKNNVTGEDNGTLEIYILKGSGYVSGYVPAYIQNDTQPNNGYGYEDISEVDNVANHLILETYNDDTVQSLTPITTISFNTGTETSIAIFIRGVGPYDPLLHGEYDPADLPNDKDKGYMNGSAEIIIDNLVLDNSDFPTLSTNTFTINGTTLGAGPVPMQSSLNISGLEVSSATLYSLSGQTVAKGAQSIDVDSLASGAYVLEVEVDGKTTSKLVVK